MNNFGLGSQLLCCKIEPRKMTSHFKLVTRKLLWIFSTIQVSNSKTVTDILLLC